MKFNEVIDLIHEAIELALKADALAKEAALEVARAKSLYNILKPKSINRLRLE